MRDVAQYPLFNLMPFDVAYGFQIDPEPIPAPAPAHPDWLQLTLLDVTDPDLLDREARAADAWVVGFIAQVVEHASIKGSHGYFPPTERVVTNGLGLKPLGRGVEKTAYMLPSGQRVVKLERTGGHSLRKEQDAMDYARTKGLPVPEQRLMHRWVAMAECCIALNKLDHAEAFKLEGQYLDAMRRFQRLGADDLHHGNFGVRADGTVVCIDLGFGVRKSPEHIEGDEYCPCNACHSRRAHEHLERVRAQHAAWQAQREQENAERAAARQEILEAVQAAREAVNNITGLEATPDCFGGR